MGDYVVYEFGCCCDWCVECCVDGLVFQVYFECWCVQLCGDVYCVERGVCIDWCVWFGGEQECVVFGQYVFEFGGVGGIGFDDCGFGVEFVEVVDECVYEVVVVVDYEDLCYLMLILLGVMIGFSYGKMYQNRLYSMVVMMIMRMRMCIYYGLGSRCQSVVYIRFFFCWCVWLYGGCCWWRWCFGQGGGWFFGLGLKVFEYFVGDDVFGEGVQW